MIEFEMSGRMADVASRLEELIGPRKYYIHNRIGGEKWEVKNPNSKHTKNFLNKVIIKLEDDAMASYVALMLSK